MIFQFNLPEDIWTGCFPSDTSLIQSYTSFVIKKQVLGYVIACTLYEVVGNDSFIQMFWKIHL